MKTSLWLLLICASVCLCAVASSFAADVPQQQDALAKAKRLTEDGRKLRDTEPNEAVPLFEEAVKILEKELGDDDPKTIEGVFRLARLHHALRHFAKAEPLYLRVLKNTERSVLADPAAAATNLTWFGVLYLERGRYREAKQTLQGALQAAENAFGKGHSNTTPHLLNLAAACQNLGQYDQAESLYTNALKIIVDSDGPNDPMAARVRRSLGLLYRARGEYSRAEPFLQSALRIAEAAFGTNRVEIADYLDALAGLRREQGRYTEALSLYERAVDISERARRRDHPRTGVHLSNLGLTYEEAGNYVKAEPLLEEALRIAERANEAEHPHVATSLENLGNLARVRGDLAKAELLLRRARQLRESVLEPQDPTLATTLNALADLVRDQGHYSEAEALYTRVIAITTNTLGSAHRKTATSLINLASLYDSMGRYPEAEAIYEQALKVLEGAVGPHHPDMATAFSNVGTHHLEMGSYAKAEPLLRRASEIAEKALGPEHYRTTVSLHNLAELYQKLGQSDEARERSQRALSICEKRLGPYHPLTATCLNRLGLLLTEGGNFDQAASLLERALELREKMLRPEHPQMVTSLINLGLLRADMRKYAEAEDLLQRALKTAEKALGPQHPRTATCLNNLGYLYGQMGDDRRSETMLRKALNIRLDSLGSRHPETAATFASLAVVLSSMGDRIAACHAAEEYVTAHEHLVGSVFSFTTEGQRLAFQGRHHLFSVVGTLGDTSLLVRAVLRHKGIVLDSLLEDQVVARAALGRAGEEKVQRLRETRQRLLPLELDVPRVFSREALDAWNAQKAEVHAQVEKLESELARDVSAFGGTRRALTVTGEDVQRALSDGAVLVEFVRYTHRDPKASEARYGAVLIARNGEPQWIPLARPAAELERLLANLQQLVRNKGVLPPGELEKALRGVHGGVWADVHAALPKDTHTVIISPDGELNFLSFATLLTPDNQFLCEDYLVRYVSSGRDLLRGPVRNDQRTLALLAAPQFTEAPPDFALVSANAPPDLDRGGFGQWAPLPGTLREATNLVGQAKSLGFSKVIVRLERDATESALKQLSNPYVLHLATHGFFLQETNATRRDDVFDSASSLLSREGSPRFTGLLRNPMHRSGLALAGANVTVSNWLNGRVPAPDNDGVLLASEVADLNLAGTWLVVLSACDTGLGKSRTGEGVLGLRRAFVQAGAQHLLMTLWPVGDDYTARFMTNFYQRALASGDAPRALAELQREELRWLRRNDPQNSVRIAVQRAGAFVLSSQGY